jgi:hypothetical protein
MHEKHEDLGALERALGDGLEARNAPEGFVDRVMARLPRKPERAAATWWWSTAAALLLMLCGAGYWQHAQQERIAGENARAQALLALRLTAAVLNDVQQKVVVPSKGETE